MRWRKAFPRPHTIISRRRQKNYGLNCSTNHADWGPEKAESELWDEKVTTPVEIPSLFNRLVLMATNDKSFHSVNEVKADGIRQCVSNYYFSPHSPNGYETTHITYFMARPEKKFKRIVAKIDGDLRTVLRKAKKDGFAKKDLFEGEPK